MKDILETDALKIPDIKRKGNLDWSQIGKVETTAEGWSVTTSAIQFNSGCLIRVTTQYTVANELHISESLTFAPVTMVTEEVGNKKKIYLV